MTKTYARYIDSKLDSIWGYVCNNWDKGSIDEICTQFQMSRSDAEMALSLIDLYQTFDVAAKKPMAKRRFK
jgi:hypothetical protein